ncbi:MAG: PEGA domain-containing protein [Polyangiaceae bacterium]|nr:PEGA domain-containing protein [Polyangiaceae bacterium]
MKPAPASHGRLARALATIALAGALAPGVAAAESAADRATARELAREGQAAFDAGDFALAADRFGRANSLVPAPSLAVALARAQVKLGQLVKAYEGYSRVLRDGLPAGAPAPFRKAVEVARAELPAIEARLAWLTVTVPGVKGAQVSIDGERVPEAALGVRRAVDPGRRRVRAEAPGHAPTELEVELREGEQRPLELRLEGDAAGSDSPPPVTDAAPRDPRREPAAPPPHVPTETAPDRTWAWIALGVGGAGLAVGAVTGMMAISQHSTLEEQCDGARCPKSAATELDAYRLYGLLSTLGFGVGLVGAGAGTFLLVTEPAGEDSAAGIRVGPAGATVWGRF